MRQRFAIAELPSTPWKNGGGSTREVASWPPGAGFEGFDWRVSIATISASGPFSVFAGVDRVITLLDGDGVHLRGEGVDHRLATPLEPFAFSGDAAIGCDLLGGACNDFNVMTRRGRLRAQVRVLHASSLLRPTVHGLLLAWRGNWRTSGESLAPGQGVWWAETAAETPLHTADPGAALLAVQWEAVAPSAE